MDVRRKRQKALCSTVTYGRPRPSCNHTDAFHYHTHYTIKERRRISIAAARNQSLLYMEMRVGVESVARARENPQAL
jgi:hypothetical protein